MNWLLTFFIGLLAATVLSCQSRPMPSLSQTLMAQAATCHPSYPDFCIPPSPDRDCKDIPQQNFRVLPPDPHRLDRDMDGIGCEAR
ncbi:MAG TPA: hypothetical protein V6D18_01530 [Thermosynechococcaceae cyanobacterium]